MEIIVNKMNSKFMKKEFVISLLHRYGNRGFLDPLTELLIIRTAPNINSPFHISVCRAYR